MIIKGERRRVVLRGTSSHGMRESQGQRSRGRARREVRRALILWPARYMCASCGLHTHLALAPTPLSLAAADECCLINRIISWNLSGVAARGAALTTFRARLFLACARWRGESWTGTPWANILRVQSKQISSHNPAARLICAHLTVIMLIKSIDIGPK